MICQYHFPLKNFNSFQTEANAKLFCEPDTIEEIKACLREYPNENKLLIGKGCNLFFTRDFDGLVIKNNLKGIRVQKMGENEILLEAMGGEDWDSLVEHCVKNGYAGLENLSLIPGTVGASPVQNIGAYGTEVKDCITEIKAIDTHTLETITLSNEQCRFGYRESVFKHERNYMIISVTFKLKRHYTYRSVYPELTKELQGICVPNIQDVRQAVIAIRKRKLPDEKELPNCGSFFKNPYITKEHAEELIKRYPELPLFPGKNNTVKISAAFLIEKSGYKGVRIGNVGTYPQQPLIIVNYDSANGAYIVGFMQMIQHAVEREFNIKLEPEVRIL
jgi:UDP-N-acetylmuramate dehydrogenase